MLSVAQLHKDEQNHFRNNCEATLLLENSVPITTERSFNAEVFTGPGPSRF